MRPRLGGDCYRKWDDRYCIYILRNLNQSVTISDRRRAVCHKSRPDPNTCQPHQREVISENPWSARDQGCPQSDERHPFQKSGDGKQFLCYQHCAYCQCCRNDRQDSDGRREVECRYSR